MEDVFVAKIAYLFVTTLSNSSKMFFFTSGFSITAFIISDVPQQRNLRLSLQKCSVHKRIAL
jgi:hypothetical protein